MVPNSRTVLEFLNGPKIDTLNTIPEQFQNSRPISKTGTIDDWRCWKLHWEMIFFSTGNGCIGAAPDKYAEWFAEDGGLSSHENNYPYLEANPLLNCDTASTVEKWNPGYKISSALSDYSCTEDKMKQLVASNGAVLTAVYASDTSFDNYASGVYDGCSS